MKKSADLLPLLLTVALSALVTGCTTARVEYDRMIGTQYPQPVMKITSYQLRASCRRVQLPAISIYSKSLKTVVSQLTKKMSTNIWMIVFAHFSNLAISA